MGHIVLKIELRLFLQVLCIQFNFGSNGPFTGEIELNTEG